MPPKGVGSCRRPRQHAPRKGISVSEGLFAQGLTTVVPHRSLEWGKRLPAHLRKRCADPAGPS